METIIGISCLSHDAAVAVIRDDQIAFASQAERYSRKKNDKFLNDALLSDVEKYADSVNNIIFYERPLIKKSRQLFAGQYRNALLGIYPENYLKKFPLLNRNKIHYSSHHFSHACAGYYTSVFREAVIVVIDAIGEWETLTVWHAKDNNIKKITSTWYPNSLGLFYSAFTQRIGYKPNEEEYIMMGLAAFGEPIYAELIKKEFFEDLPPPYFKLKRNVHRGIKGWHSNIRDIENLAASCQKVVEDFLLSLFCWIAEKKISRNLVYSGGLALNCVFNQKLGQTGYFDNIWILPEPGDAGNSIGAALVKKQDWVEWKGPYLGHDIGKQLDIDNALDALLQGKVIGVAHGRSEFGPRALGNRSLIADPRGHDVKAKVNKIKKRELFRPFAPVVLEEYATEYFDLISSSIPYMQFVANCKRQDLVPAVCHVDGTSRVQTLTYNQNPDFYRLLKLFFGKTGCPILLNTSLNIKGEPLVNNWTDAQRFSEIHGVAIY